MEAGLPFARTLIVLRCERTFKKTAATTTEARYYLSSAPPREYTPAQWLELIRGHWGGVEIRNHWRRDAIMGEDHSRTRNPNVLANLALLRNVLLALLADHFPEKPLPQIRELLHSNTSHCLALIAS